MLATCLLLAACGGDGGGDGDGAGSLPAPAGGKATIGGKLVKDGRPLPREQVSLSVGGKRRAQTRTDAGGRFAFRDVAPARYAVGFALTLRQEDVGSDGKCDVPGYQGLQLGGMTRSGEQITLASLESDPFEVEAGDRVVKDITVNCGGE